MIRDLKTYVLATSALCGTIIGVGLFSLPYLTAKIGFWMILAYFLTLGPLVILVHLFFGELALKTPDFKRLPGFAKVYLGKWGERIAFATTILGIFGAALVYLMVGGEFLTELFQPIFGGTSLFYTLFYFGIGAFLIFYGIKAIAKVEFLGLFSFFIILLVIFFWKMSFIKMENLFPVPDWAFLFLPYGVIIFSLWGAALIPEIEEILRDRKKTLLKIIPISIIISVFIYLFFIYLILGISGTKTSETALPGLKVVLDNGILSLALFLGFLTTFTSFITLGLTLKKVFWYDLKIEKNLAWAITCFIPLILFLIGLFFSFLNSSYRPI